MTVYRVINVKYDRRASRQRSNIENLEHILRMVLGVADVALDVELPGEGGAEGGSVQEAATSPRDRLGVVAVVGSITVAAEDGEQVS